mgnify:CR=1 FL=1
MLKLAAFRHLLTSPLQPIQVLSKESRQSVVGFFVEELFFDPLLASLFRDPDRQTFEFVLLCFQHHPIEGGDFPELGHVIDELRERFQMRVLDVFDSDFLARLLHQLRLSQHAFQEFTFQLVIL